MLNIGKYGKYVMTHFRQQTIVGLAVMLSLTAGMLVTMPEALAAGVCRGDPIVTLSNGYQLSMSVSISLPDASNVNSVVYTVHVPTGLSMVHVVYTGGQLQQKETVRFFADQPANHYTVDFLVTSTLSANVTANVTAGGYNSLIVTNGLTNYPIHVALTA